MVEKFVQAGAKVAIADADAQGESVTDRWRSQGYEVRYYNCYVSSGSDVGRTVQLIENDFESVDVLVNNAGTCPRGDLQGTDEALWVRVMASI
ncbi:SDR family NAD(P)-dependent oxidoreductase [Paenibacillus xerothermodurans]|uniref:SDR family NAD(P)-dependent oxidoreductase n=1 Tax=Paenibacillus xerothermodurans TaxID=1977292 RepID=A0A2W1NRJ7_PAEXE|nr:SDR family NAD(P)-dependent oxidoreductase [Paenibacillus xerothermodurans]